MIVRQLVSFISKLTTYLFDFLFTGESDKSNILCDCSRSVTCDPQWLMESKLIIDILISRIACDVAITDQIVRFSCALIELMKKR